MEVLFKETKHEIWGKCLAAYLTNGLLLGFIIMPLVDKTKYAFVANLDAKVAPQISLEWMSEICNQISRMQELAKLKIEFVTSLIALHNTANDNDKKKLEGAYPEYNLNKVEFWG